MPNPMEGAMRSKNAVLGNQRRPGLSIMRLQCQGFAGIITAAAAWSIWGGDIFPAQSDPTGSKKPLRIPFWGRWLIEIQDPENWSEDEMRRWLNAVGLKHTRLIII